MLNALLLAMILACPAKPGPTPQEAEALQRKLGKVIHSYTLSEKGFHRAVMKVSQDFEIPMGLEWVRLRGDPQEVTLTWQGATVLHIIKTIAKSRPGYDVEVRDGIVHVFYVGAATDKSNFLNLKIGNFQSRNEYVAESEYRLHRIVAQTVSPPPPPIPGKRYSEAYEIVASGGDNKASFQVQNATVRQILDKMALATDGKMWVVTFDDKARLTPTGFRRTIASLWNSSTLPDKYQPAWDFVYIKGNPLPP